MSSRALSMGAKDGERKTSKAKERPYAGSPGRVLTAQVISL